MVGGGGLQLFTSSPRYAHECGEVIEILLQP